VAVNDIMLLTCVQTEENNWRHVWWSTSCCMWLWRGLSVIFMHGCQL